jgi:hypothetical protein
VQLAETVLLLFCSRRCLANNTCAPNRQLPYLENVLCGQCEDGYSLVFSSCVSKRQRKCTASSCCDEWWLTPFNRVLAECPSANGGAVVLLLLGLVGYNTFIYLTVQESSATTGILL